MKIKTKIWRKRIKIGIPILFRILNFPDSINHFFPVYRFYENLSDFLSTDFVWFAEIPWFGKSFLSGLSNFIQIEKLENPCFGKSFLSNLPKFPVSANLFYPVYRNDWLFEFFDFLTKIFDIIFEMLTMAFDYTDY